MCRESIRNVHSSRRKELSDGEHMEQHVLETYGNAAELWLRGGELLADALSHVRCNPLRRAQKGERVSWEVNIHTLTKGNVVTHRLS